MAYSLHRTIDKLSGFVMTKNYDLSPDSSDPDGHGSLKRLHKKLHRQLSSEMVKLLQQRPRHNFLSPHDLSQRTSSLSDLPVAPRGGSRSGSAQNSPVSGHGTLVHQRSLSAEGVILSGASIYKDREDTKHQDRELLVFCQNRILSQQDNWRTFEKHKAIVVVVSYPWHYGTGLSVCFRANRIVFDPDRASSTLTVLCSPRIASRWLTGSVIRHQTIPDSLSVCRSVTVSSGDHFLGLARLAVTGRARYTDSTHGGLFLWCDILLRAGRGLCVLQEVEEVFDRTAPNCLLMRQIRSLTSQNAC
ncbi:hypothetical protein LSH36_350g03012 [Paralvinella palmiformis]|uniref:Uncharacterized protein n=1 Tax=Paralvinella palmiformis TaxID=53620 RepID=A0AAD9JG51_9ANNE|nr:hypothetical protein LSH36_350g03012 [Paralvinella palmiformis]